MYTAAARVARGDALLLDNGATLNATSRRAPPHSYGPSPTCEGSAAARQRSRREGGVTVRTTALVVAARGDGSAAIVRFLIAAGADPRPPMRQVHRCMRPRSATIRTPSG